MKIKKSKFVEIVMSVGAGCHSQISKKENYTFNPISVMARKGFTSEIWTLVKQGKKKEDKVDGVRVRRFSNVFSLYYIFFLTGI